LIDDEPDDVVLAARHAEVVDRLRVGTIRHDGTHLSLDDDDVREQVWSFIEEMLAAMVASGEAEHLAAEDDIAREAARRSTACSRWRNVSPTHSWRHVSVMMARVRTMARCSCSVRRP
jgi:hypothetical protein